MRLAAIVLSLLALCSLLSAENALEVEGQTAVSGATGVPVRILADCDQEVTALSFAATYPSELSNVSLSLGDATQGAGWSDLDVYGSYVTVGIIIEYRTSSGGPGWGALPVGADQHVVTFTCDVATGLSVGTVLTVDLQSQYGSPPIRAVFTDQNAQSVIPNLYDGGIEIVAGPSITAVDPQWGPVSTQTSVTITGSNFQPSATVTFGGQPASNVTVVDSSTITCDTAAIATAGKVDVTVDNGPQYGSVTASQAFEYVNLPEVTGVTPSAGKTAGGDHVTVHGENFLPNAEVSFDGLPLTNVTYVDSQTLEGDTPAHSVGLVDVTVTVYYYGDPVSDTLAGGFEYVAAPTITSITPNAGHGNETATIEGTNFRGGETEVYFGATPCTDVNVIDSTSLTCTLPACPGDGPVDISVTTPGGTDTLVGGYECTNTFRRGDANCSSDVDIADAVYILDYLFNQGPANCLDAADVNDDGNVDISDPVYDLMYLFRDGAPAPPAPFPDLGKDPTSDSLDCAVQCGS